MTPPNDFAFDPSAGDAPPDADLLAPVEGLSSLEELEAEIAAEVAPEPLTLEVGDTRPGWQMRYAVGMSYEQLQAWTKKARDKHYLGGIDRLKLACTIVANQCEAILKLGKPITSGGDDVTFATPDFRRLLDATGVQDAVVKWFGADGYVLAHAQAIVTAAGFEGEVERVDPTGE